MVWYARIRGLFYWRNAMSFKTWVQIMMGVTGFLIWSYASYMQLELPDDYLQFVKGIVIGVAALALRDMGSAKDQPVKTVEETKKDEVQQ
jgi:hypothetical protein